MSKTLTVREMLKSADDSFDPMTLDTSEIRELSCAIPKDGNIDINNAEVLATKCLRGADLCSELMAIATAYAAKMDAQKKKAYAHAALIKSAEKGIKTDKSRAWFAEQDDEYIEMCNKCAEAQAFLKWVSAKYDSLTKVHYMAKKILERGYPHERQSNWNGMLNEKDENGW